MSQQGDSVILEEQLEDDYEPSNEEIMEYAAWLGLDVQLESNLVWIAREGLKAPLPEHWKPCRMPDNDIYYFNFQTGESTWDHPCDEYYRRLYVQEKEKHDWRVQRGLPPMASPPQIRGQISEPPRRRLPSLPDREYENQANGHRPFVPDSRSPVLRWEEGRRSNSSQDGGPPSSRRPSRDASSTPAGGQAWPRVTSPTPPQEATVTKYELYSQRQVQPRPDRHPNTPQKSGPDESWGRQPLSRGSNTQQSPHPLQRPTPSGTPWAGNGNPISSNRSSYGAHQQAPRSATSAGPSPHVPLPAAPTPLSNGAIVNPWSDDSETEDDEKSAKNGTPGVVDKKRRPSKSPAVPDEHIMKAQEVAHRRKFMALQQANREEWEKDVWEKEIVAREEYESNMAKDTDAWKMERRELMIQQQRALEADYNEQLARLKSPTDAAKAEVEALMHDAEAEAEERKEEMIEEARRAAEDAKRAMLQQARNEVEGEKQRLMQMLRKEMEPPSPAYSQDERSVDPNDKVNRWKAIMQEDSARQREALEEKVAQDMAGEEAHMIEKERRHMQRLVQERTAAIEAQLRIDEEVFYEQRRQELEERIQQRMSVEEELMVERKRAELEASLSCAYEKEKGDREISMRFELEKEMQAKRRALQVEISKKHHTDGSDSGSPSGFMANLLPSQQLTEGQTLEKERAQMVERVRAVIAKEEEQLLREQREAMTERVKRTLSEEAGEKSGGPVEDKRMSEGENKPPGDYSLDRSLSMEGLQEGFEEELAQGSERGAVRDEVARVEGDGRARLERVKEEAERQVRGAREKELAEWEARTRAELEAEKERRVAQMRSEVEMLVKSERLKLAKQRAKDVAEAKRGSESDRPSAESSPTPQSVLPRSDAWKASEVELRAANEKALAELQAKHAQAVEELEAAHKVTSLKMEATKEALQQELRLMQEQLEGQKTAAEDRKGGAQEEVERVEREGKEKLEAAREKLEAELAELHRSAEEGLKAVREKVERETAEEEVKAREAMEAEVADRIRKNKRRLEEDDRKKMAETKKEMKVRQEFLRAKMEVELEREMKYEREERAKALRQEMEAQQEQKKSQAEEELHNKAAQIKADAATALEKLRAAKLEELKEDKKWLEKEFARDFNTAREEIVAAQELRLQRLKRETQDDIEREEAQAEERKAERSRQLERTLQDLELDNAIVFEEARRKTALHPPPGLVQAYGPFAAKQTGKEGPGGQPKLPTKKAPNGIEPQGGVDEARGDWGRPQGIPLAAQPPGAGRPARGGTSKPGPPLGDSGDAQSELERAKVWEQERAEAEADRVAILQQVKIDTSSKKFSSLAQTRRVLEERSKRDTPNGRLRQSWHARSVGGSPNRRDGPGPGNDESGLALPNQIERSVSLRMVQREGGEDIGHFQNESEDESIVSAPELGRVRELGEELQMTAQLMDELRKDKVMSLERMRRERLEAGSATMGGNDGGNGEGPGAGSAGHWSKMLDVQNEREGNVDMRLGRMKTEVSVTGKAPMVPLASQDAQTPMTMLLTEPSHHGLGFEGSVAEVGRSDKGLIPQSKWAVIPALESLSTISSAREDASSRLLDQPFFADDVSNLPTPKCAPARPADDSRPPGFETEAGLEDPDSVAEEGTDGPGITAVEEASLSDMPRDVPREPNHKPATHESVEAPVSKRSESLSAVRPISPPGGGPSPSKASPPESTGEEMEISPIEDFEDMESLSSTVASARAGASDAGRRAWEEHFGDRGLARASSLPLQRPEDGPSLPRAELSMGEKASAFLSLQRKFLKERQIIIEQARADWKMRMQELDEMLDGEDRRRKRRLLLQLKLTLEDSAHRVNEEARQMRALKTEVLGEAPPSSAAVPVFRTTLPVRNNDTPRRWSTTEEVERPRTADSARRNRTSWSVVSPETVQNNPRSPPQPRNPLSGRLMGLLARWTDEHQIASDLALQHNQWVDAFRERLHTVGAVSAVQVLTRS